MMKLTAKSVISISDIIDSWKNPDDDYMDCHYSDPLEDWELIACPIMADGSFCLLFESIGDADQDDYESEETKKYIHVLYYDKNGKLKKKYRTWTDNAEMISVFVYRNELWGILNIFKDNAYCIGKITGNGQEDEDRPIGTDLKGIGMFNDEEFLASFEDSENTGQSSVAILDMLGKEKNFFPIDEEIVDITSDSCGNIWVKTDSSLIRISAESGDTKYFDITEEMDGFAVCEDGSLILSACNEDYPYNESAELKILLEDDNSYSFIDYCRLYYPDGRECVNPKGGSFNKNFGIIEHNNELLYFDVNGLIDENISHEGRKGMVTDF